MERAKSGGETTCEKDGENGAASSTARRVGDPKVESYARHGDAKATG